VIDALTAIEQSISLVKRLREISKNISGAEFKNILADLTNELADAKLQIATLKDQLAVQAEQIQSLRMATPGVKEKPSVKWGCYQFEGDQGLYCTACYDTKGAKCLTTRVNSRMRSCPVCKAVLGS